MVATNNPFACSAGEAWIWPAQFAIKRLSQTECEQCFANLGRPADQIGMRCPPASNRAPQKFDGPFMADHIPVWVSWWIIHRMIRLPTAG
jgi:hypothetical protein